MRLLIKFFLIFLVSIGFLMFRPSVALADCSCFSFVSHNKFSQSDTSCNTGFDCIYPGGCYKYTTFSAYSKCDNGTCIDFSCDGTICCGEACFVEGTEIDIPEQESKRAGEQERIENLEVGDVVSSFNPETGEVSESQVAEVHKITREGYYELETESGKKVKVTGEHPFLAIKAKNFQFPISNFQLIDKLKNVLSNTLTFRLIATLQTKFF